MSILGMCGAEAQRLEDDGVISVISSMSYSAVTPAGSASARSFLSSNQESRIPFVSGEVSGATPREPSGSSFWFHGYLRMDTNNTNNDTHIFGVGRNGTELFAISFEDSTLEPTIRVNGAVVATASGAPISEDQWTRYHVHVDNVDTVGFVKVYAEGDLTTPIVEYTLPTALAKPNEFYTKGGFNVLFIDDIFCLDPEDATGIVDIQQLANASVQAIPFTGDGNYTDWTGTYADIDEIPADDGDYINADAVDQASTFTHGGTVQDHVHFVQTKWRMTRTGTDAGVQVQIRLREGTTDKDEAITTAPGSGNVIQQHHTAPDGTAWDKAHLNATEFGPVSRT